MSFTLTPADGGHTPGFAPGRYAAVAVTLPDGTRHLRHYTLAHGREPGSIRITVRRLRGFDVLRTASCRPSCTTVSAPATLSTSAVRRRRHVDTSRAPLVLISAGVGITARPRCWTTSRTTSRTAR